MFKELDKNWTQTRKKKLAGHTVKTSVTSQPCKQAYTGTLSTDYTHRSIICSVLFHILYVQRIFNGLTLNMEFISRVRQDFLYHKCKASVKIYGIILSHKWNIKFHIQHQKHWYMAQILLMQRKTLFNQSIDQKHWMFFLLHFLWFLTCFF